MPDEPKKHVKITDFRAGDVDALVFESPLNPKHFYLVGRDDMDYLAFLHKYNVGDVQYKRATGVELGGCDDHFFMVYVEDCFDPPIAIVRADSVQDAEEKFLDELAWADIGEADLKDYGIGEGLDPDKVSEHAVPNNRGGWSDTESIMIREIKLVRVEID